MEIAFFQDISLQKKKSTAFFHKTLKNYLYPSAVYALFCNFALKIEYY